MPTKLPGYLLYLCFAVLAFAVWKGSNHFFWRDEWHFLFVLMNPEAGFFTYPFEGHIKPLFKLFYYAEVLLFRANALFYHYTNILVFAGVALLFYRFARQLEMPRNMTLATVGILILHPINFVTIMWSFQVSIWLQLGTQILFIMYLIRYHREAKTNLLLLALLFLVIQHYLFGNGMFMPLVGILYVILFFPRRKVIRLGAAALGLQIILLAIQFTVMQITGKGVSTGGIIANLDQVAYSFIHFVGTNINRLFFVKDGVGGVLFGLLIMVALLVLAIKNYRGGGRMLLFLIGWFLAASVAIPVARFDMPVTHFYYTTPSFVPMLAVMLYAANMLLDGLTIPKWVKPVSIVASLCLFTWYYLSDQHAISIFTQRDLRNKVAMDQAIRAGTNYVPYDDPVISLNLMTDINSEHSGKTARIAYEYWLERTPIVLEKEFY